MISGLDTQNKDKTSAVFKALASAPRRKILTLLREGEQCVCHLEAWSGFRQAYLSQQLKVLREAGLIEDRRSGWNVYYRIVHPQIHEILDDIKNITGEETNQIKPPKNGCPCPKCSSEKCCSH
jgi:ArsR family transcriptional regulator